MQNSELHARHEALRALTLRMAQMAVSHLLNIMTPRFASFPDDYLVIDTETTGVKLQCDYITQMGHCLVKGRKVVDRGSFVLDWTKHPGVDQRWLQERLLETRLHVERNRDGSQTGRTYHMTYDKMASEGVEPTAVMQHYLDWFKETAANKMVFVGHNSYNFDANILQAHFRRLFADDWKFDEWGMFDTGMVLKASQAAMAPWEGETPGQFYKRVNSQFLRGIYWSLDRYAVPTYKLADRYGLDMKQAHDASFDCYVTHLLFETLRDEHEASAPVTTTELSQFF